MGKFGSNIAELVRSPEVPDLTLRQIAVLHLACNPRVDRRVRKIASDLGVPTPAVSRAADKLTSLGLVGRQQGTADRRDVIIMPTQQGFALLARMEAE